MRIILLGTLAVGLICAFAAAMSQGQTTLEEFKAKGANARHNELFCWGERAYV